MSILLSYFQVRWTLNNPYPKIKSNNELIKNNMITYVFPLNSTSISASLVYLHSNVFFNSKNHL